MATLQTCLNDCSPALEQPAQSGPKPDPAAVVDEDVDGGVEDEEEVVHVAGHDHGHGHVQAVRVGAVLEVPVVR